MKLSAALQAGSGMEQISSDEGAYWFRRGRGSGNSGRMRLTSLKWAKNN